MTEEEFISVNEVVKKFYNIRQMVKELLEKEDTLNKANFRGYVCFSGEYVIGAIHRSQIAWDIPEESREIIRTTILKEITKQRTSLEEELRNIQLPQLFKEEIPAQKRGFEFL